MIFERNEGLSFCYAFSSVLDIKLRCYGLCFLVNIVNYVLVQMAMGSPFSKTPQGLKRKEHGKK